MPNTIKHIISNILKIRARRDLRLFGAKLFRDYLFKNVEVRSSSFDGVKIAKV